MVTSLLGTTLTQVALGQSHVAVLTDMGKLITFGLNKHGQCGRNYVPIPEKETGEPGKGGQCVCRVSVERYSEYMRYVGGAVQACTLQVERYSECMR